MGGFPEGQTMVVPRVAAGDRYEPNALMDALSKSQMQPRSPVVTGQPQGPMISMTGYNDLMRYLGLLGKQTSFGVNALSKINDQY